MGKLTGINIMPKLEQFWGSHKKKIVIVLFLLFLISAVLGWIRPAKVRIETRTETKVEVQIREVVKEVVKEAEAKVKVVYRTKIIKPDGTQIETVKEKEETRTERESNREEKKDVDKTVVARTDTLQIKEFDKGWTALGMVGYSFKGEVIYGAGIQKQIMGPLTVGAWGLSNSTVGVSIGVTF